MSSMIDSLPAGCTAAISRPASKDREESLSNAALAPAEVGQQG
jgi:hypothetical protein